MKPFLIGYTLALRGLALRLGESVDDLRMAFTVVDLRDYIPGGRPKKSTGLSGLTAHTASSVRRMARSMVVPSEVALFVGRGVASAFRFDAPYLVWGSFRRGRACVLPHPSSKMRWWANADNVAHVTAFVRSTIDVQRCQTELFKD